MKLARAVHLQGEFKQRIKSVYRESASFARTHDEHIKAMKLIYEQPLFNKAPSWMRAYLRGVDSVLFDLLYEVGLAHHTLDNIQLPPLCFVNIGPDGRMFGPDDESWLLLNESAEYKSTMKGTHAWRYRWERGEFKPW